VGESWGGKKAGCPGEDLASECKGKRWEENMSLTLYAASRTALPLLGERGIRPRFGDGNCVVCVCEGRCCNVIRTMVMAEHTVSRHNAAPGRYDTVQMSMTVIERVCRWGGARLHFVSRAGLRVVRPKHQKDARDPVRTSCPIVLWELQK
jgi:hypothetical protein